jgi:hypothetical protein
VGGGKSRMGNREKSISEVGGRIGGSVEGEDEEEGAGGKECRWVSEEGCATGEEGGEEGGRGGGFLDYRPRGETLVSGMAGR